MRAAIKGALSRTAATIHGYETFLLNRRLALYGVAVGRILGASAYVGILVTDFGSRSLLFGPASDWARSYRDASEQSLWSGALENANNAVFTGAYLGVIALGVAFILGWRARLTGALFLFGAVQILQMDPLVSDQGDNIIRIGLFLILLTECSEVWSLDAHRRARREASGSQRIWTSLTTNPVVVTMRTLVHNGAVLVLGAQLITVYVAAGMYKVAGNGWRMGTAIAYPLRGDEYRVWPALNDLVVSWGPLVWAMTYFAVFLQLYFPVLLLNKVTRRLALISVLMLHIGIAVLMGLPWFTLGMVAFDGIFVSTTTYLAFERVLSPRWLRLRVAVLRRMVRTA